MRRSVARGAPAPGAIGPARARCRTDGYHKAHCGVSPPPAPSPERPPHDTVAAFWRIRPLVGALLVPYLAWVGFAADLNWVLWRANPVILG
ncbi:MAG: tryptophan-rich sensory protein [Hydrogenophaga sp.]|nr:tryptophan-rich sensory protein [Hydrogenophaga sp.]MDP2221800.1 tryptophan-rich sensory protein [Hydrogenophaga sp.]